MVIARRRENGQIASVVEYQGDYERLARERLAAKSKHTDGGCIEWTGAKTRKGYGQIRVRFPFNRLLLVHRLVWILEFKSDPGAADVCHTCDNPSCLNPAHLFLGTRADNMRDMVNKGRAVDSRGENSGRAKLSDGDIALIKEMAANKSTQKEIAQVFGVHPSHVSRILGRKRWPHR